MTDLETSMAVAAPAPTPRSPPDYIRLFAATSPTAAGRLALEYTKSLLRVAPVRVIPADGPGIWPGFEELLLTRTHGTYVNVVAADAHTWCRAQKIEMPARPDPFVGVVSSSWHLEGSRVSEIPKPKPEVIISHADYWTAGVRNILFAATPPRNDHQLAAAQKFDAIVVPDGRQRHYWSVAHKSEHPKVVVIQVPAFDEGHRMVRELVLAP